MDILQQADPEVWQAIQGERQRQQHGLEMIASENYTSPAVLAAQGSVLTNKYAEGYPGRRYYGGCEFVDVAERLAIDRALQLFKAERANVQPHSGAQANMGVYFACLEPGDTICKQGWAQKVNQSVFPGMQGGPLMHVVAAKAIAFGEALRPEFRVYAAQIIANARTLAHELERLGFRLVSGGTDNHLLLVDVVSRGVTGKIAEQALDAASITVNKNMIPFDARAPLDPSGIRIGTPALTTRGMKEPEMRTI